MSDDAKTTVIRPPDDEGFNPITIRTADDGHIQLRQTDWMGNASVVCFDPRQAGEVVAAIRKHAGPTEAP